MSNQVTTRQPSGAKIIGVITAVYVVCFACRVVEYFWLRTDQTFFGEAFVHKLLGLAVGFAACGWLRWRPSQIGFNRQRVAKNLAYGLALGVGGYVVAYGVEFIILAATHQAPTLHGYVTSYAVDGNLGHQTGFWFFVLCVVGNVINVLMEEGVFRGLFVKLAEQRYRFGVAVLIASVLFGLWHLVAPLRSFLDGERSWASMVAMMVLLFFTTAITGVKFCLLTKISGSLWLSMADHFVNNTVVNLLHVHAANGIDGLQTVRVAIAQTLSCIIVLVIFLKGHYYRQPTFRPVV